MVLVDILENMYNRYYQVHKAGSSPVYIAHIGFLNNSLINFLHINHNNWDWCKMYNFVYYIVLEIELMGK